MSVSPNQPQRLSQRELRNESGRVLRAVDGGQEFIVTNGGVPVGRIVPMDTPAPLLPISRPVKRKGGWSGLGIQRKQVTRSLAAMIDDERGDRR